jgi:hypothetical protein
VEKKEDLWAKIAIFPEKFKKEDVRKVRNLKEKVDNFLHIEFVKISKYSR